MLGVVGDRAIDDNPVPIDDVQLVNGVPADGHEVGRLAVSNQPLVEVAAVFEVIIRRRGEAGRDSCQQRGNLEGHRVLSSASHHQRSPAGKQGVRPGSALLEVLPAAVEETNDVRLGADGDPHGDGGLAEAGVPGRTSAGARFGIDHGGGS